MNDKMDKKLNAYLARVENYLRPLAASERIDIVAEIKSQMLELQTQEGLPPQDILARLGDPKTLAMAYLGDSIVKSRFSLRRLFSLVVFCGMVGFGGTFILPFFGMLTAGFLFAGVIAPLAGILKTVGWLLGFDMPFVMFQLGSYTAHPLLVLPLSLLFGALFLFLGEMCWRGLKACVRTIGKAYQRLETV